MLLQRVGGEDQRVLYELGWDEHVTASTVRRYQRGDASAFANTILLRPRVGDLLVQLNGLLRPLIHRQWAAKVARINDLEEARLEAFLFGAERIALTEVRAPLLELQDHRCFYCGARVAGGAEVDHFLPWSRYPDNSLDNLVVADRACNNAKRDFLAASGHVEAWVHHAARGRALAQLAVDLAWDHTPTRTLGVARAIYLRLPPDVRLWDGADRFVPVDPAALRAALVAVPGHA